MKINNIKANKCEWSEFYAFLKIIDERQLFAADESLKAIPGKFFKFNKIIREESVGVKKIYDLSSSTTSININDSNDLLLKKVIINGLSNKVSSIFKKIKNGKKASFLIPEATVLMNDFLCSKVKASNTKKADLQGVIFDRISETSPTLGFSIKSMIGGASTLLNAGKTTNFVFKVEGLKGNIEKINSISTKSKIRDRLSTIIKEGGVVTFSHVLNQQFDANLKKIDTIFALFLAQMVYDFFLGKAITVSDLVSELSKNNLLLNEYGLTEQDYELKVKNFLDTVALGMVPGTSWDGFSQAHGGYIVVKDNGEVLCYHLYNRDDFRTYLYKNTKFESASSSRHEYGKLYKEDGKILFNLNLQIRFVK